MKFWHQKFMESELDVKSDTKPFSSNEKSKTTYLLHQFSIWISIFFILFLIANFLKNNTNLTNI
jgi:hypothetical protein